MSLYPNRRHAPRSAARILPFRAPPVNGVTADSYDKDTNPTRERGIDSACPRSHVGLVSTAPSKPRLPRISMELFDQIEQARQFIQSRWKKTPRVAIVLGTGLGGLAADVAAEVSLQYQELPHFLSSTAPSHKGQLVCGTLGGKPVVAMEGRFHFYEGYKLQQITFPVRVMKALGCDYLIVSNACGGMNPQWARGDIMVIEDHINLMGDNPLIGKNDDRLGERFPDMSEPYSHELIALAQRVALEEKVPLQKGVYVAVPGPNLETRAEYR